MQSEFPVRKPSGRLHREHRPLHTAASLPNSNPSRQDYLATPRYLLEAGFTHAAFVFGCESQLNKASLKGKDVPVGALVSFIQKGFQYMEIEANLNEEGTDVYGEYTPLTARDILTKDLEELRVAVREMREEEGGEGEEGEEEEEDLLASGPVDLPPSSLHHLEGHSDEVYSVAWCPTANLLASSSGDATARIWDLEDVGSEGAAGVRAVVCQHEVGSGEDGAEGGEGEESRGHVTALDWSPDGRCLATGAFDGGVRLWNRDGSMRSVMDAHSGPLFCLKYNRKGDLLLSGGVDQAVIVWDTKTGSERQRYSHHTRPVLDVAWRTNSMFATCSQDRTIVVARVGDAKPVKVWQGHTDEINSMEWGPGGRLLASCSDDRTVRVWHFAADKSHGGDKPLHTLKGHTAEVYTVRWGSPDSEAAGGRPLLASGSFDHTVKIWDADAGQCLQTLRQHEANIYSLAWSPDGNYLATGSFDGQVHIWGMRTGTLARSFKGSGGGIYELGWNSAGDMLAACFQNMQLVVAELRK